MVLYVLGFLIAAGVPAAVLAQFVDKGAYVEVAKGTKLCSNVVLETSRGKLDSGKVFWRVTSNTRANGTQTVTAFVLESAYDRKSGDTKLRETLYDEEYAVLFKWDPARKGMLLMISPQDGRVEATVERCPKRK